MPGATPTAPTPLRRAAIVPATCVPWPLSSCAGAVALKQLTPCTAARSVLLRSMPVSRTATGASAGSGRGRADARHAGRRRPPPGGGGGGGGGGLARRSELDVARHVGDVRVVLERLRAGAFVEARGEAVERRVEPARGAEAERALAARQRVLGGDAALEDDHVRVVAALAGHRERRQRGDPGDDRQRASRRRCAPARTKRSMSRRQRVGGHRAPDVEALGEVAPERVEAVERLARLDALGGDLEVEVAAELDRRADDRLVAAARLHPEHERLVDLDLVDREPRELRQRGEAGAEVVDGHGRRRGGAAARASRGRAGRRR